MFNLDTPFFRPVWVRVLTLVAAFGWALWELSNGAVVWAIVFGVLGAVAAWQFYIVDWSKYDAEDGGGE